MNLQIHRLAAACLVLASAVQVAPAHAGVTIGGTRVVFPGQNREVTVHLQHSGETPSLVQTWIDDGDIQATPSTAKAPFVVRPPIFRMDAGKKQVLRIVQAGAELPQDRESLYWFNVREVPASAPKATVDNAAELRLIVRTRIKLLYRPKGLTAAGAQAAPRQLSWRLQQNSGSCVLSADNATAYHVNVNKIDVGPRSVNGEQGAVAPFGTKQFTLELAQCRQLGEHVNYQYINDFGAVVTYKAALART